MYTELMIYFLLCVNARIFTVEELQDLPINISSILSPSKIIDYDLDSSYIGISDNRLNSRRESVLKLLKSDSGYIIEASNRFITVTMNNKIVLTRNVTRASEFKIISRGPGFSLQVGSKCLFNDRDRLKLTTCEESTLPWRKSQQVWMICLLPNSMLRLFYEMCEDDDCDQDYTGRDVDFSNLFEKSIVDNSLSDSLVPFLKINNYLKKKEKICKNRARCYEECTCKCN